MAEERQGLSIARESWVEGCSHEQADRCAEAIQKLDASGSVVHLLVQRPVLSGRSAGEGRNREKPLWARVRLCGHLCISGVDGTCRRDGGAITCLTSPGPCPGLSLPLLSNKKFSRTGSYPFISDRDERVVYKACPFIILVHMILYRYHRSQPQNYSTSLPIPVSLR